MRSTFLRARRRALGLAASAVVVAIGLLAVAAPASAHDQLLSTDPADGAVLEALPTEITFTFSDVVVGDLGGNEVEVTDAAGTMLTDGDPVVTDNVITQQLTGTATGAISVAWRAVSEDGHPISGVLAFTVTAPASPTATPTATPTTTPTAAISPAPTAVASPSTTPAAAESPSGALPLIVLVVVIVLAVAAVVWLLVVRGRSPAPPRADGSVDR